MSSLGKMGVVSLLSISLSVGYLAYTISEFKPYIPIIVNQMDTYGARIDHLNNNLSNFNRVGAHFNQQSPGIKKALTDVSIAMNRTSQAVYVLSNDSHSFKASLYDFQLEMEAWRGMTPSLLSVMNSSTNQIRRLNDQAPDFIASANALTGSIDDAALDIQVAFKTAKEIQPSVDNLSREIEEANQAVPFYLAEIKGIIKQANEVGEKASEGIVGGFLSGIVTSPIQFIKSTERSMKALLGSGMELEEEELKRVSSSIQSALHSGDVSFWNDKKTKNRGTVTPSDPYSRYGRECRTVTIETFYYINNYVEKSTLEMCRSSTSGDIWIQI
jgi:hypothetical protein